MSRPPSPTNVRIRYPDGSEQPLELVYREQRHDGVHVWESTGIVTPMVGMRVLADSIPPQTAIELFVD